MDEKKAMWSHIVPFAAWIALMYGFGAPAAWKYAVRAGVSLALLLWLRPWRWYQPLRIRHLPLALGAGVFVFAVWVLPESPWMDRWPVARALYAKWILFAPAQTGPALPSPYAPEVCGWPLVLAKIAGSAFVIAVIEEFFWRGFVYRWLLARNFLGVDLGLFQPGMFFAAALAFGLEHGSRWLVGFLAGAVYGFVMIRTRNLWAACVAHVVTNFLLGWYVVATGSYAFW